MAFEWNCPFCDKASIVTDANYETKQAWFALKNAHGSRMIELRFIVCANPKCREFTLDATMFEYRRSPVGSEVGKYLKNWPLVPPSGAKSFPSYVPKAILDDYVEACLVRDLSPKASATLSRRCLQGMIRDFWEIQKGRLIDEVLDQSNTFRQN